MDQIKRQTGFKDIKTKCADKKILQSQKITPFLKY